MGRLVLDAENDATPVHAPFHIFPSAAPSGTMAEGDIYFDDTTETLETYDGSQWNTLASLDTGVAQVFAGAITSTGNFAVGADKFNVTAATGNTQIDGTLDVDGAVDIDGALNVDGILTAPRKIVSVTGATHDLEAIDSGAVVVLNRAAGIAITLPTAANGLYYKFIVDTTLTGSGTITAEAGDLLTGTVSMIDTDTTFTESLQSPDGTDDLIITMNGTTTGGLVPSWLEIYCVSATNWVVHGTLYHNGNVATPFS
jgi:hypothetical protein